MEFHVDQLNAAFICGWGRDDSGPLRLSLIVNGSVFAETVADEYRPDVEQAGLGSNHLGYAFRLRRPGLATGDTIEISDTATRHTLYKTQLDAPRPPEIDLAYDYLDEQKIERPFLRASLAEYGGGKVALTGEVFVPASLNAEPALIEDDGSPAEAMLSPASTETTGRYWWLDGRVVQTNYVTVPGEKRVILRPKSKPDDSTSLNFAVIPSRTDLANFQFAGREKARRGGHGDMTTVQFASSGLTAALQILSIAKSSPGLESTARVLDWGCGSARVLQFLKAERRDWEMHGADIDAVNIDWCRATIPGLAIFRRMPLHPPTAYPNENFDLIYGLSVISHLEEKNRNAWIEELARITKKGGTCLLTYDSAFHLLQAGISPSTLPIIAELASRGISDHLPDTTLGADLSTYYKRTFMTYANICEAVGAWFDVVSFHSRALDYQETVVLRRRVD